MNDFNDETLFSINKEVVYTKIDDEAILMGPSIEDEELYGANSVGTEIWKLLESQPMSVQMVSDYLLREFEVEETQSKVDARLYLESLLAEKLIIKVNQS